MRRKDREMPGEFARGVADRCLFSVVSMVTPEGKPYAVPLTLAREGNTLYFHCAADGRKTECLRVHPEVCVACVGDVHCPDDRFTALYESAIAQGVAREVTQTEEKIQALRLICERFSPANMARFDEALARSLAVTAVWRIDVTEWTGKAKR